MYRLYASPATASLVVHWMLLELGVPFEIEMLDFDSKDQKSADYLRLNPGGVVFDAMTMQDRSKSTCFASTAIDSLGRAPVSRANVSRSRNS